MNDYRDDIAHYVQDLCDEGYELSFSNDVRKDQLLIRVRKGYQQACGVVNRDLLSQSMGFAFATKMVIRDLVNKIEKEKKL